MTEEEIFLSLYSRILLQGDVPESKIEDEVHKIMDNPEQHKWYFYSNE